MKRITAVLVLLLCLIVSARAEKTPRRLVHLWIPKETFGSTDAAIRVKPDVLRVTQCTLYPWDEDETRYSLFIEVENTSDEAIVMNEGTLSACDANGSILREEDGFLHSTRIVIKPGETAILYAGAEPDFIEVNSQPGKERGYRKIEGLENFASQIKKADQLHIQWNINDEFSSEDWAWLSSSVPANGKAWIEDGQICVEVEGMNESVKVSAVVYDSEGRILDYMSALTMSNLADGTVYAVSRDLSPYITEEMLRGAQAKLYVFYEGIQE